MPNFTMFIGAMCYVYHSQKTGIVLGLIYYIHGQDYELSCRGTGKGPVGPSYFLKPCSWRAALAKM